MNKQLGLFDAPVEEKKTSPIYAVFDLETGGLDPVECGLCSIAIIQLDQNFEEYDRFYFLLYEPDKRYEAEALKVNGFTRDQLERDGLRPETFIPLLHQLLDKYILVAHNAAFDAGFLNQRGWNITESIDTMMNDKMIAPVAKHKLGLIYNRLFGHDFEGAHNALADVEATIKILQWQVKKNPQYGVTKKINFERSRR